jgi:predicted metal-dependent HD superfamily phosphohydrolase
MSTSNNELSSSVLADMIERWNDMTTYMTEEVRTRWWKRILDAYSEKHRKYHNLYHIYQLFQVFGNIENDEAIVLYTL